MIPGFNSGPPKLFMTDIEFTPHETDKLYLRNQLQQARDPEGGSAIEGPLRPAIVKIGEAATYSTYGAMTVLRGIKSAIGKFSGRAPDTGKKTPRNAYLD
jgi:hypothetical protein